MTRRAINTAASAAPASVAAPRAAKAPKPSNPRGPRSTELHSADIKIDQKAPLLVEPGAARSEIVLTDQLPQKEYLDELAFNEEPVTIRIEPSSDKNAPAAYPIWNNGKGCEVWQRGRWEEITYLPVGRNLIIKRKYLAIMATAKQDTVHTEVKERDGENPENIVQRFTSAVMTFSVLEDKNPRGAAWLTELRRRNF
jgi:hypothetical protein